MPLLASEKTPERCQDDERGDVGDPEQHQRPQGDGRFEAILVLRHEISDLLGQLNGWPPAGWVDPTPIQRQIQARIPRPVLGPHPVQTTCPEPAHSCDVVEVHDMSEQGRRLALRRDPDDTLGVHQQASSGTGGLCGVHAEDPHPIGFAAARARTISCSRSAVDICVGMTTSSAPSQAR